MQVTSVLLPEDMVTPGSRLPKIRNTHPRNYNDLKGKGIDVHIFILGRVINIVNWITMTRKSAEHLRTTYGEHWTAVSTLFGFIRSVYCNLHHWRSNQWPQIAVPKLYNWATSSYHTQVTPNQLVMVIARPNNLNVSCKLHLYSFQRTRSPTRATSSVPICRA